MISEKKNLYQFQQVDETNNSATDKIIYKTEQLWISTALEKKWRIHAYARQQKNCLNSENKYVQNFIQESHINQDRRVRLSIHKHDNNRTWERNNSLMDCGKIKNFQLW